MGRATVISEKALAKGYSSVWRTLLPLGEPFTRGVNTQLRRFCPPTQIDTGQIRMALASELGFRFYAAAQTGSLNLGDLNAASSELRDRIEEETIDYISRLPRSDDRRRVTEAERAIGIQLASRTVKYLGTHEADSPITTSPRFPGCGFVDSCFGDLLAGDTLYEIKNVERLFRAVDIRQLLVYCGLAKSAGEMRFRNVGFINARHGTFIKLPLEQVAFGLAGVGSAELLDQIVQFICSEQISH